MEPLFEMNLNTLNILMNIRDYAKEREEEGQPFDTSRSLTACARDVPTSKGCNKRKEIEGEEDGDDPVVEEGAGVRRSGRVVTPRTLQIPEYTTPVKTGSATEGRRKRGKGRPIPAHMQRMIDFGIMCWGKYGEGKDYKRAKDYRTVVSMVPFLSYR